MSMSNCPNCKILLCDVSLYYALPGQKRNKHTKIKCPNCGKVSELIKWFETKWKLQEERDGKDNRCLYEFEGEDDESGERGRMAVASGCNASRRGNLQGDTTPAKSRKERGKK